MPKALKNTVYPFNYNDFDQLEEICQNNDIGVIKMEVIRNSGPEDDFLKKVRQLATNKGIVLVFDECTSGFRETFGGIHKKFDVEPDLAMYGKTIGNGYALTAVVGKKNVMSYVESTFISSTFWTERIGPTAALKTLEVMERIKSWDIITNIGNVVREAWEKISKINDIPITISGIPSLSTYKFNENNLVLQTFVTQEMLKKGYLASDKFYACISHNKNVDLYLEALNDVFYKIRQNIDNGIEIKSLLKGPVRHSGFKRLN